MCGSWHIWIGGFSRRRARWLRPFSTLHRLWRRREDHCILDTISTQVIHRDSERMYVWGNTELTRCSKEEKCLPLRVFPSAAPRVLSLLWNAIALRLRVCLCLLRLRFCMLRLHFLTYSVKVVGAGSLKKQGVRFQFRFGLTKMRGLCLREWLFQMIEIPIELMNWHEVMGDSAG